MYIKNLYSEMLTVCYSDHRLAVAEITCKDLEEGVNNGEEETDQGKEDYHQLVEEIECQGEA